MTPQPSTAILSAGHRLGALRADNRDYAISLGLEEDWITRRTGILRRAVAAPGEDALSLAAAAARVALDSAGLSPADFDCGGALLYIHNSLDQGTPPAAIRLAAATGLRHVRAITLDGVCSEPVQAIHLADAMLGAGLCRRVLLVAAVDYPPLMDPQDPGTAGLFGSGGGALLLARSADPELLRLRGTSWESDSLLGGLGTLSLSGFTQLPDELIARVSYYSMHGEELARHVLARVPAHFQRSLGELGWSVDGLDCVVAHQPNVKLLRLLGRRLGLSELQLPAIGAEMGNLGPASLPVGLALRLAEAEAPPTRVVLLGFGLGFCCGTAAFERGA